MALKCQNLERNEIEIETFVSILIPRHWKAFKSFIHDSAFFHILTFQCHSMPTFLLGFVCIDISFFYHNLAALMLIFTFLSILLKHMVVEVLCMALRRFEMAFWVTPNLAFETSLQQVMPPIRNFRKFYLLPCRSLTSKSPLLKRCNHSRHVLSLRAASP